MTRSGFRLNRRALFGMMVLAAAGAMPVQAATIAVNTTLDIIDAADGKCSLREAVIAANTNAVSGSAVGECSAGELAPVADVISLPAGTYTLDDSGLDEKQLSTNPLSPDYLTLVNTPDPTIGDLDITESVTIVGAGSSTLTPTTIQWSTAEGVVRDRIFHVYATVGDIKASISGVKLTNGRTTQVDLGIGPPTTVPGGVLPTNYYLRRGGGALAVGPASAIVLVDPNVTGADSATDHGGTQRPDTPDEGGATFTLALNDVIVDGNHADGDGGGIYNSAPMTATNIVVSNNDNITNGGGLYNEGLTTITNSTISGNISEGGGGLFLTGTQPISIVGTTFSGNRAVGGGAISGRSGVAINVVNSTLSGNLARDIGAGFYHNGPANLNFVTIANNVTGTEAPGAGSGINTFPSGATAVAVKNVLLAANVKGFVAIADAAFPELYKTVAIPQPGDAEFPVLPEYAANCGATGAIAIQSSGNNLSSDASCATVLNQVATDMNGVDPKIGTLADNGGLTQTHALLAGSPALSAGASDAAVTTDQRGVGFERENPPDIGAFELDNITESSGGGGGCAVGGNGRLDPTLPAMLAAALAFFGWRRRADK